MEYTSIVKERLQKRLSPHYSHSTIESFITTAEKNNGKITISHSAYLLDKAGNFKSLEKNTETGYTGYKSVRGEDVLDGYLQSTTLLSKISSYVPQKLVSSLISVGVAASIFLTSFVTPASAFSKDGLNRLRQMRKNVMSRGYIPTTEKVDGKLQAKVEEGYRIMAKRAGVSELENMTVILSEKVLPRSREQKSIDQRVSEYKDDKTMSQKVRETTYISDSKLAKEDRTGSYPSTIEARTRNLIDPTNVSIVLSPMLYSAEVRGKINYAFEHTNRANTKENKQLALDAYRLAVNPWSSMEFRERNLSQAAAKEMSWALRLTSERRMLCGAHSSQFKCGSLELALQGVKNSSLDRESKKLVRHYLQHPHSPAEGSVTCSSKLVGFDADTMLNKWNR